MEEGTDPSNSEKRSLGDHDAAEADHRQLAAGDKLVGEGPREAEELTGLGNAEHQALAREQRGPRVSPATRDRQPVVAPPFGPRDYLPTEAAFRSQLGQGRPPSSE